MKTTWFLWILGSSLILVLFLIILIKRYFFQTLNVPKCDILIPITLESFVPSFIDCTVPQTLKM